MLDEVSDTRMRLLWPLWRGTVHPPRFDQANLDPSPVHFLPDWEHWWDRWLVKGWHQSVTFCSCVERFSKTAAVMGRCRHGCCSRGGWQADSQSRGRHSNRRCTKGHLIAEVQRLTLSCYLLELNTMMNSSDPKGCCPTILQKLRSIQFNLFKLQSCVSFLCLFFYCCFLKWRGCKQSGKHHFCLDKHI